MCPSAVNGLVGIKPTVGLVSRTHVVPISHSQDTPGPMGRSVADVAPLLTAMAGSDPADAATAEADARRADYTAALDANALQGKRIGVLRFMAGFHRDTDERFAEALAAFARGRRGIRRDRPSPRGLGRARRRRTDHPVGGTENRPRRLSRHHAASGAHAHAGDVIAFNTATPRETTLFGQDLFERAQATGGVDDPRYRAALARAPVRPGACSTG